MILKSESKSLKQVSSPPRERKYALVAYARLLAEFAQTMPSDILQ